MKEANLKRPCSVLLEVDDMTLWKKQNYRTIKNQWIKPIKQLDN